MPSSPGVNHVFVDFENLPQLDPDIFTRGKPVQLTLLLGARQTKLDSKLVENLLQHPGSVNLVRLSSSGRDALDFTLAYYLGRAVLADPTGYFHIVSKDTGFSPLVEHLQERQVRIQRHDSFDTLTFAVSAKPQPKKPSPPPVEPQAASGERRYHLALGHLRNTPKNLPKSRKTLISALHALLGKDCPATEVETVVSKLQADGFIGLDAKGGVTYSLGISPASPEA